MRGYEYRSGESRLAGLGMPFDSIDVFKCVAKDVVGGDHQGVSVGGGGNLQLHRHRQVAALDGGYLVASKTPAAANVS